MKKAKMQKQQVQFLAEQLKAENISDVSCWEDLQEPMQQIVYSWNNNGHKSSALYRGESGKFYYAENPNW